MEARYFNRELSWLEFNARVLAAALDVRTPLFERLKFLAIVTTNFDEFFMVRVASLKRRVREGDLADDESGMGARATLARIRARTLEIVERQYACLTKEILPSIAALGVEIVPPRGWSAEDRRFLESRFEALVFPVITPLRAAPAPSEGQEDEAFPPTGNLRMHVAFELGDGSLAIAQVPPNLGRFVRMGAPQGQARFALMEDVVAEFGARFFPGYETRTSISFKVTRDADEGVDEDRETDFLAAMEEILDGRQDSLPVRLAWHGESAGLADRLRQSLGLEAGDCYRISGPLDLPGFMELLDSEAVTGVLSAGQWSGPAGLRDKPWPQARVKPQEGESVWDELDSADRLLHVPYESFDPVVRFLDTAAEDPSVLAIKMTLYRTSSDSPVVRALTKAARNGKQVAVVVELKARFDEGKNIAWAEGLGRSGAIVTYGVARLKVHAKAALVIRRTQDGQIRRYAHLSTGNYNDRTARLYSDLSIFTSNEEFCREISIFFNILTGYSTVRALGRLAVAPFDMKARLLGMIEREAQRSTPESPGLIMAKLNALSETDVIDALYAASRAGVRIRLNVRGICTLVPGVPGMSENIEVHSLLGRYLEHSRIVYFRNGGADELYLASADWLPRNLGRRIELMFPVIDEAIRSRVMSVLESCFADTRQSHALGPDGAWTPIQPAQGAKPVSAQEQQYRRALALADAAEAPQDELQVRRRIERA